MMESSRRGSSLQGSPQRNSLCTSTTSTDLLPDPLLSLHETQLPLTFSAKCCRLRRKKIEACGAGLHDSEIDHWVCSRIPVSEIDHWVCSRIPVSEIDHWVCSRIPVSEIDHWVCSRIPVSEIDHWVCSRIPVSEIDHWVCSRIPVSEVDRWVCSRMPVSEIDRWVCPVRMSLGSSD